MLLGVGLLGPPALGQLGDAASADPEQLQVRCEQSWEGGMRTTLQSLEQQLLQGFPWGDDVPAMLRRAEALLSCRAPAAAQTVLGQVVPGPAREREAWLRLRWRAAHDAGDHHQALEELQRSGWRSAGGSRGRDAHGNR